MSLKPFSTGGNYINFQTDDETDERTEESYRGNMETARTDQGKVRSRQRIPREPQHRPETLTECPLPVGEAGS